MINKIHLGIEMHAVLEQSNEYSHDGNKDLMKGEMKH